MNISSHYGSMPRVETEFWNTPSGPAWAWWVLAILPLDTMAQVVRDNNAGAGVYILLNTMVWEGG